VKERTRIAVRMTAIAAAVMLAGVFLIFPYLGLRGFVGLFLLLWGNNISQKPLP